MKIIQDLKRLVSGQSPEPEIDPRVRELIQRAQATNAKELDLSDRRLTTIPDEIFELEQLEVLDLSSNPLTTLPEAVTRLTNLRMLYLRNNPLTTLPEGVTRLTNLTTLDLSFNQLTMLPEAVTRLTKLTTLDLSRNQLTMLPEAVTRLTKLTTLDLSRNQLTTLPESVTRLTNLTRLDLGSNRLTTLPEAVTRLTKLTRLDLGSNRLTTLPEAVTRLTKLTTLDLGGNELTTLPEVVTQLTNLAMLDLNGNRLTTLPEVVTRLTNLAKLDLGANRLTTLPEAVTQLTKLATLDLRSNRLTTLPEAVTRLTNLTTLDLSYNQLTTLPEAVTRLTNLIELYLRNNLFAEIPEPLYAMSQLKVLLLGDLWAGDPELKVLRNSIKVVPRKIVELENLQTLELEGNPIETPPPEVAFKGIEAIRDYYRQIAEEGEDALYEAKLLIVGEPGAGKTTLAKKIVDPNYVLTDEKTTEGIEVTRWEFPMPNGKPFRVNIWDFGGQEIYHATHQFFLTHRSLYLLVADARKEDTDFFYWLNIVEILSDNSPLLIVNNEKQDRKREINERVLRGQFTNLKETLGTNLATQRGLSDVIKAIEHYITTLPHVGTALPRTWVKVREKLEQDPRNYISLPEFLDLCAANGFSEHKDKLQLSGYLHDLGVILHFQDDLLLKQTVILKPKWGTDAVYAALDNDAIRNQQGRFTVEDVANIWRAAEYANKQAELLQLMINFKLCYKIPNSPFYIAPQLLSEQQPAYEWDASDNRTLRYTYEFMPKGILTQFIVAMHTQIENQALVWKTGVVLAHEGTRAQVIENYGTRQVQVHVAGAHKRDLLTIVMHELDKIHASYPRLKYDKWIPCNCAACQAAAEPSYFKFEVLQRAMAKRRETIQCQVSFEDVNVRGLIDDVINVQKLAQAQADARIIHNYYGAVSQHHGGTWIQDSDVDITGDVLGGDKRS